MTRTDLQPRTLFSLARLQKTWRALRKELARNGTRDCIDYLDIDTSSDTWLAKIRDAVIHGGYSPQHPARFEAAKKLGAYRTITRPAIRDVVVFRHICDAIYEVARPVEPPGAFFSRRHGKTPIGKKVDAGDDSSLEYAGFFEVWMRYKAYREHVGLRPHRYVVVSDITNYFDSIQHALLLEHLAPLGIARQTLGLLGRFLDVLRPASGDSPTPAVGLPVDEFECSRTLAHVFLFEHDRRIEKQFGKEAYVRWMDDQTIGVGTRAIGRRAVRELVSSLATQRLTLNSGKTKILPPEDLAAEFLIPLNNKVDELEDDLGDKPTAAALAAAKPKVKALWKELNWPEGKGHWEKVAKRLLRWAAPTGAAVLTRKNASALVIKEPILAERVFEYLQSQDWWQDYLDLFERLLSSGNSLYEDVEALWFEMCLRVSPPRAYKKPLRTIASEFARGTTRGTGRPAPRVPAAMLLYWLGDGRNWRGLWGMLKGDTELDGPTRRTIAAILCAVKPDQTDAILLAASKQASPHVSSFVEWMLKLRGGEPLQLSRPLVFYKNPPALGRELLDARGWLRLELLSTSPRTEVRRLIAAELKRARVLPGGDVQQAIADRVELRLR